MSSSPFLPIQPNTDVPADKWVNNATPGGMLLSLVQLGKQDEMISGSGFKDTDVYDIEKLMIDQNITSYCNSQFHPKLRLTVESALQYAEYNDVQGVKTQISVVADYIDSVSLSVRTPSLAIDNSGAANANGTIVTPPPSQITKAIDTIYKTLSTYSEPGESAAQAIRTATRFLSATQMETPDPVVMEMLNQLKEVGADDYEGLMNVLSSVSDESEVKVGWCDCIALALYNNYSINYAGQSLVNSTSTADYILQTLFMDPSTMTAAGQHRHNIDKASVMATQSQIYFSQLPSFPFALCHSMYPLHNTHYHPIDISMQCKPMSSLVVVSGAGPQTVIAGGDEYGKPLSKCIQMAFDVRLVFTSQEERLYVEDSITKRTMLTPNMMTLNQTSTQQTFEIACHHPAVATIVVAVSAKNRADNNHFCFGSDDGSAIVKHFKMKLHSQVFDVPAQRAHVQQQIECLGKYTEQDAIYVFPHCVNLRDAQNVYNGSINLSRTNPTISITLGRDDSIFKSLNGKHDGAQIHVLRLLYNSFTGKDGTMGVEFVVT